MRKALIVLIVLSWALLLTSCGGSGSAGAALPASVTVSGQATFERVVPQVGIGLDYAGTTTEPIREALVEVRRKSTNTVWSSGYTDNTGNFSLTGPAGEEVRIVVSAQIEVASGNVSVRTGGPSETEGSIWGIYSDVTVPSGGITGLGLLATSGWNTTGYNATQRASGPFAILDTMYRARELVRNSSSDDAPALKIFWDPSYTDSNIGTSFFSPSQNLIRLLGEENDDTDEFDHNVVAHEWCHAYQANSSRDDSLGGAHGYNDKLDEVVAFSEGLATAVSGMVMGNTQYLDTNGNLQASFLSQIGLTNDSPPGLTEPGPWNEFALVPFLFNLYHSSGDNIGFGPFHSTLTGAFKDANSFTTVYSFLHYLKAASSAARVTAIENRASAAEMNINSSHDQFDGPDYVTAIKPLGKGVGTNRRYTTVTPNGTAVHSDTDGDRPEIYNRWGTVSVNANKLYNRLFFKSTLTPGTYTIRATPTNASGNATTGDLKLWVANIGSADTTLTGAESLSITVTSTTTVAFAVSASTNGLNFVVQVGTGTLPVVLKPSTPIIIPKLEFNG